jgi:uncharacterized protein YjbJ (UPF0337 family)
VTIADRTWDRLPPEIHSRIMAATAHADERRIRQSGPAEGGLWTVDAITGDRFVHMTLGLRPDHSVSEETRSLLVSEILEISVDGDDDAGSSLTFVGPAGPESLRIPTPIGRALRRRREGALEEAVKGIGQGIAGRLKEVAGELLDLAALEEEGITQQRQGEARRAPAESKSDSGA